MSRNHPMDHLVQDAVEQMGKSVDEMTKTGRPTPQDVTLASADWMVHQLTLPGPFTRFWKRLRGIEDGQAN